MGGSYPLVLSSILRAAPIFIRIVLSTISQKTVGMQMVKQAVCKTVTFETLLVQIQPYRPNIIHLSSFGEYRTPLLCSRCCAKQRLHQFE